MLLVPGSLWIIWQITRQLISLNVHPYSLWMQSHLSPNKQTRWWQFMFICHTQSMIIHSRLLAQIKIFPFEMKWSTYSVDGNHRFTELDNTAAHFPLFSEEVFSEFCCFKIFLCIHSYVKVLLISHLFTVCSFKTFQRTHWLWWEALSGFIFRKSFFAFEMVKKNIFAV